MLRINGEITSFVDSIDFENKDELMTKLRFLRKNPNLAPNTKYQEFYDMIGVAIQQAFYTNPNQLVRYKGYCKSRVETGANNGRNNKSSN